METPPIPDREFFSIGEVSRIVQVPPYVLRYWESEFKLLRPARRASGQRKYTRSEVETVFRVKDLLHNRKFTIAGAKKQLIDEHRRKEEHRMNVETGLQQAGADLGTLADVTRELEDILAVLRKDLQQS